MRLDQRNHHRPPLDYTLNYTGMLSPSPERPPLARLALVLWTVLLTSCALALVAAACWFSVRPISHDDGFVARYAVLDGFFYPCQPAKTLAFQCCLLAAPICILLAVAAGRRVLPTLGVDKLQSFVRAALGLHVAFFVSCIRPLVYYPHPPLWLPPTWLLCPLPFPPQVPAWEWITGVLLAVVLGFVVLAGFPARPVRRLVLGLVTALAILCAPVEFYAPAQVANDTAFTYHLNALLDALSQSVNGHHLLIDFPHIYGGYGEMLAPWLRLFPRAMAVPLIALALPTLLGVALWLIAAVRLVKNPAVLALVTTSLLGVTYLSALPPNYVYGTPRTPFPSIGLVLAVAYLRRPGALLFGTVSLLAAIASVWNLDTGLVLWLAWTITLLAGDATNRDWPRAARHLLIQLAALALAWIFFFLYLRLAEQRWPDFSLLFYFQSMVVRTGYFCVPMIVPSAWTALAILYVTGLVVAALAHLRRRVPWQGRVVLFLSLLGIGMFSYYVGRAAESNLIEVSPPGIILAGLLGSEMLARVRRGILPAITRWFFVPWAAMIFWWAFLFFVHLPVILQREAQLVQAALNPSPSLVQNNATFATRYVTPGESDVYFLSGHSGFYYYLTGTVRPLRIPGNVELLRMRDMQVLIDAIQAGRIPKLFIERNFWKMDMYRRDVYAALDQAVAARYRVAALSDAGLVLYLPNGAP